MRVLGTAGHVDHGKSTLVLALTGINPDRLAEEIEREMTIDLGFAWLTLPGSGNATPEEVGIIDVPGHRDFIENMLAGIGGIDAALFVVASDEGVMPQTREHLAILDILEIKGGVVALTKIDLVDDPDWLDLVESDLSDVLADSVLANAPIVRVSAKTGAGIDDLLDSLSECLAESPSRPDVGKPRLPIDRVFTIAGFGTVVTGTLNDGHLQVGDEITILPDSIKGRVRGLQTHKHKENIAIPGSRTAVNISGISLNDVKRGDVLVHPGHYQPTRRLDVKFRLLPEVKKPIRHNTQVKLFIGASESIARLRLLGVEELQPGKEAWLQLEPINAIVAARGDRYILRRPSPGETLGGGVVIDPHPDRRYKRFSKEAIRKLEVLADGAPLDILLQALTTLNAASLRDVIEHSRLNQVQAERAAEELFDSGQMINLVADRNPTPKDLVISQANWQYTSASVIREVDNYHVSFPLRTGIPREELKSRMNHLTHGSSTTFNAILRKLVTNGILVETGPLVHKPEHKINFTKKQQTSINGLMVRFAASPYAPPTIKEVQAEIGHDLTEALIELEELIVVSPEVAFRRVEYDSMVKDVRNMIINSGGITVAQARDHFNTSRRYVLALLEHLDSIGETTRDGDIRRLKN